MKNKDHLEGWMIRYSNGKKLHWTAVRAPELKQSKHLKWGKPIHLLKHGLSAWKVPDNNSWALKNGILIKKGGGTNIMTKQKFWNFKLHLEFRYSKHANSGIYLRGRYEVQILDSFGMHTGSHQLGGVYGQVTPTANMAKKPGEWQTLNITLNGRYVTVILNGKKVICDRPIGGITGGALSSDEGQPGPIMIQGSETGSVEFRDIVITPAK